MADCNISCCRRERPDRVINGDETGLQMKAPNAKATVLRGTRQARRAGATDEKSSVTAFNYGTADGDTLISSSCFSSL